MTPAILKHLQLLCANRSAELANTLKLAPITRIDILTLAELRAEQLLNAQAGEELEAMGMAS